MAETLDLDKLLPEPRDVTICGKKVKVFPGKMKTILALQRAFGAFQQAKTGEQMAIMENLLGILCKMMPALKDEDMDIAPSQIPALVEIAYESFTPKEQEAVKEAGMEASPKKNPKTLPKPSPTS